MDVDRGRGTRVTVPVDDLVGEARHGAGEPRRRGEGDHPGRAVDGRLTVAAGRQAVQGEDEGAGPGWSGRSEMHDMPRHRDGGHGLDDRGHGDGHRGTVGDLPPRVGIRIGEADRARVGGRRPVGEASARTDADGAVVRAGDDCAGERAGAAVPHLEAVRGGHGNVSARRHRKALDGRDRGDRGEHPEIDRDRLRSHPALPTHRILEALHVTRKAGGRGEGEGTGGAIEADRSLRGGGHLPNQRAGERTGPERGGNTGDHRPWRGR